MKKLGICLVLLGLCSFAITGCAKKEAAKPKASTSTPAATADKDKETTPAAPAATPPAEPAK